MNSLKSNTKFQALSADEATKIKGGWRKKLPALPPISPGGIGGTPPPVTNSNGGFNNLIP
jgi:hypothetical protein